MTDHNDSSRMKENKKASVTFRKPVFRMSAQPSDKKPVEIEPKRKRSFMFYFPFTKQKNKAATDSENGDDPVMALFAARNTQKVRFSLEGSSMEQHFDHEEKKSDTDDFPDRQKCRGQESGSQNIKKFVKGALFGKHKSNKDSEEFDRDMAIEIESARMDPAIEWESEDDHAGLNAIHFETRVSSKSSVASPFIEDKKVCANITKLLNKSTRARYVFFRYEYAVKVCMNALTLATEGGYPESHPTVVKILQALNAAHHALSSYQNSANIVRMGIRYEDAGELVRALKMYSIAYRIRRDSLSPNHPSLVVLLNMLGSVQMKRDELGEAMEIFEIAVKDDLLTDQKELTTGPQKPKPNNLIARSVAYREMGLIHERWQEPDKALLMYIKSLECVAHFKGIHLAPNDSIRVPSKAGASEKKNFSRLPSHEAILLDLENVHSTRSFVKHTSIVKANRDEGEDGSGGMELLIGAQAKGWKGRSNSVTTLHGGSRYDIFFPRALETPKSKKRGAPSTTDASFVDVDTALTLHQIGQLHRAEGQFDFAMEAYTVALRGMKYVLGKNHPNVAAILGNIGNLQKDMGDMDAAYDTYQKVLAIETSRLGLSHPDVAVTLHNIATIDAARGKHSHALVLYQQVVDLQRKLFGDDHITLAVTTACQGDVHERVGQLDDAIDCFEEALRIKTAALGRHSVEVARLLHKLGKLNAQNADYHVAESFISRAILVYRLNKLPDDGEWLIDAHRDAANIDAAISMGKTGATEDIFEC